MHSADFGLIHGFTPSCRYVVAQVTFACVLYILLNIHMHCTSSYMYALSCLYNLPIFSTVPYAGSLQLCLFNHTSYLIPHHHYWLEKNRHKLKCCDVIYFVFSLVNSKPVYFKCDFPLVQINYTLRRFYENFKLEIDLSCNNYKYPECLLFNKPYCICFRLSTLKLIL